MKTLEELQAQYQAYEDARVALTPSQRLQKDGRTSEAADALIAQVAKMEASASDQECSDLLNSLDPALPVRRVHTDMVSARGLLLSSGFWPKVLRACASADEQVGDAAILLRDSCSPPLTLIHTGTPETLAVIESVLGFLVARGVLTADVVDGLLSFSKVLQSWADVYFDGPVSSRDVALARGAK